MNRYHVEIPKSGYRGFNYSHSIIVTASKTVIIDGRLLFLDSGNDHIACFEPGHWLYYYDLKFFAQVRND